LFPVPLVSVTVASCLQEQSIYYGLESIVMSNDNANLWQ